MLRFTSKKTGIKGRAALTLKSPDLIRVEIYGAMGHIISVITGDSDNCSVYKEGGVKVCRWDNPELSGLLTPKNLVPILLGRGELAFRDSRHRQSFSDNYGRLTRIVTRTEGETVTVSIGDYRIVRGLRVPFSFTIRSGREELSLDYYSLTLNPPIEDSTFSLTGTQG